jgi:L-threonylcarbamoyladenylate synthase
LDALRKGGLILYPTDTLWGIGCDATNAEAVSRIYALKERQGSKSMIVLLADDRDILQYVSAPDPLVFDYLEALTRPTTVVYEGAIGLAENLLAEDGSIGIRVVRDEFCRHLLKRFGKPIVSTSANLSGESAPACFGEISSSIVQGVDYVVKYRRNDQAPGQPSSLVRWNRDGTQTVLRP